MFAYHSACRWPVMHRLIRNFSESLQNIVIFKLRSTLTLLGVLVGTAAVVALVSSGQMATRHALAQFKTLGTDLFAVTIQTVNPKKALEKNLDQVRLTLPQVRQIQAQN